MGVETWTIQDKIDFTKYFKKPTYHTMEFLNHNQLEPHLFKENMLFLRENIVDSSEDIFTLKKSTLYSFTEVNKVKSRNFPIEYNKLWGSNIKGSVF